jgi:4-hydroxy-3-methylbut-2-enyl diphosphate reductase
VIGLTAGASAPEVLVQQVVSHLKKLGVSDSNEDEGRRETVEFSLPKELKIDISQLSK